MENAFQLPDDAQPAAYSPTSTPELESKIIFENYLNIKLVKPHLTDNDKTPNFDGYLAITNDAGVPVAKIDVQLKTLPAKFYSTPRFSYDRSFIAACCKNLNPSILVAVNTKDRIVYWHHIDLEMIEDFFIVQDRATHTVPFLSQNVIDGTNETYIREWQLLYDRALADKLNADARKARIADLEEQAKRVEKYLEIAHLPAPIVEEAHLFLDHYNSLLERDFQAIRKIIYPKTWKLGIALGQYTPKSVSHMLVPIPVGKNDPWIMRFKHLPDQNLTNLFFSHGIRSLVMHETKNPIRQYPLKYAFELLQEDVLSTIEKHRFPINDMYAANEYLTGFVEHFLKYFGYDSLSDRYDLRDLDALLKIVLPAFEATNRYYNPDLAEFDHFIDSYSNDRFRKSNHSALEITKEKLRNGYVPPVQVTLRSQKFDLELVFYYIRFLLSAGKSQTIRVLVPMRQENGAIVSKGGNWDRSSMLCNLKTFSENYSSVYTSLVRQNFPMLSEQLQLEDEFDLTIFVLPQEKGLYGQPFFTKYYLKAVKAGIDKRRLFCLAEDCPVDFRGLFKAEKYVCTIDGEEYEMKRMQNQHLDFMFSSAPVFEQVHEILGKKMKAHLECTVKGFS